MTEPDGRVVDPVTKLFRDLLAAGRSEVTVRLCEMDLLQWFRLIWAPEIN
jgi:hypothetical protein